MHDTDNEPPADNAKKLLGMALLAALILIILFLVLRNSQDSVPDSFPIEQNEGATEPLLANELIFEEESDGFHRRIEIDPNLGDRPALVRALRTWRIDNMHTEGWPCSAADETGCFEYVVIEQEFANDRFLSLLETTERYTGGAHSNGAITDHLIDLDTGETLRFGDLFSSWAAVRPILQAHLCNELYSYDASYECPDVQQQAITIGGIPNDGASVFMIHTQDYALGSYAAGRTSVRYELTKAMYAHIKDKYRGAFEKPPSYM